MSVLYDLEWRLASTDAVVGSVSGVTTVDYYDLSGLSSCTSYEWRVRADDAGTKSDWSAWTTAFQTALVVPAIAVVADFYAPCVNGRFRTADEDGLTADSTALTADRACSPLVNVGLTPIAITAAFPSPSVSTGASVSVPAIAVVVEMDSPTITTGASVEAPAFDGVVDFPVPSVATGASVEVPEIAVVVAFPVPPIPFAAFVRPPEIAVVVEFPPPSIATAAVIEIPAMAVVVNFPSIPYVGKLLEGVDRPRIVSDSPRYRVSHAA
jgi:hypothetical protein